MARLIYLLIAGVIGIGFRPPLAYAANELGQKIFTEHCAVCHQPTGIGADGLAPSLAGTLKPYLVTEQGKQYLSQILVSGMAGKIETQGQAFMGLMPSLNGQITPQEMAAALNYVLASFNGVADTSDDTPIDPAKIAVVTTHPPSPSDTRKLREAILGAKP